MMSCEDFPTDGFEESEVCAECENSIESCTCDDFDPIEEDE